MTSELRELMAHRHSKTPAEHANLQIAALILIAAALERIADRLEANADPA